MNNTINEIKSTPEGTNSIITEAEDRISEVEDIMVEINEAERKKELKEMRTNSETSGTMLNAPTFKSQESQKKTKRKAMRKYLRRQQLKASLKWGRKQSLKSKKHGEFQTGNPKQNTPKTYINQINEDKTQRTNIKSSKGKTTNNPQGDHHKDNS